MATILPDVADALATHTAVDGAVGRDHEKLKDRLVQLLIYHQLKLIAAALEKAGKQH